MCSCSGNTTSKPILTISAIVMGDIQQYKQSKTVIINAHDTKLSVGSKQIRQIHRIKSYKDYIIQLVTVFSCIWAPDVKKSLRYGYLEPGIMPLTQNNLCCRLHH